MNATTTEGRKVQADIASASTTTLAENLVLDALNVGGALTPADLKRRLPGQVPVDTIRGLLDSLQRKGLVTKVSMPATSIRPKPVIGWVSVL